MAVQAQYPSPAFRVQRNALDEFQQYHQLLGNYYNNNNTTQGGIPMLLNGTVLSEPESELTCNNNNNNIIMPGGAAPCAGGGGVSRKRNRDSHLMLNQYQQQFKFHKSQEVASTSGRSSPSPDYNSAFLLNPHLQIQDIDTLIQLQNEKLRLGLEEARKRHCTSILSVIEQQVMKKLAEKENELANATRRNAELEERLKQVNAENQLWFNVAKNNEAIASTLKSSLEQILAQNQGQVREGFGESDNVADEAESSSSCCIAVEKSSEMMNGKSKKLCCKVCEEKEVSVLLLPCRHLCLCKDCESRIDACPVCNTFKNASLQIFLS